MPIAADYPFLDVLWTMIVIFAWFIWFWLLIQVFSDLFRRHDTSGWAKAAWIVFVILLPFLGVFIYLITQSHGIAERHAKDAQAAQSQFDERFSAPAEAVSAPGRRLEGAKERARGAAFALISPFL